MLNHDSARSQAWSDCIGDRGGLWACTATKKTGGWLYPRTAGTGSGCAKELRQPDRKGHQSAYYCCLIQACKRVEVQSVFADPPGGRGVGVMQPERVGRGRVGASLGSKWSNSLIELFQTTFVALDIPRVAKRFLPLCCAVDGFEAAGCAHPQLRFRLRSRCTCRFPDVERQFRDCARGQMPCHRYESVRGHSCITP